MPPKKFDIFTVEVAHRVVCHSIIMAVVTSDILVLKLISVLVFISFSRQNFYFYLVF